MLDDCFHKYQPDEIDYNSNTCHCGEPATNTPFSPYMGQYCDACTSARCDAPVEFHDCPNVEQIVEAFGVAAEKATDDDHCNRCGDYKESGVRHRCGRLGISDKELNHRGRPKVSDKRPFGPVRDWG